MEDFYPPLILFPKVLSDLACPIRRIVVDD
jgi:hypothetical protein